MDPMGTQKRVVLRYLSLGARVQSSTIVEMMVKGILRRVDVAVFSDLEDEPAYVYRQLDHLEQRLNLIDVPLVRLRPGGIARMLLSGESYLSIPAYAHQNGRRLQLRRTCTDKLKIRVIDGYVRGILAERGLTRPRHMKTTTAQLVRPGVFVESWLGLTIEEAHRMKPSQTPWIINTWPLVDLGLTRNQCALWLADRKLPIPKKSSCRICPYHDLRYWRMLAADHPADFAAACQVERELLAHRARFTRGLTGPVTLHYSGKPLPELVSDASEEQPSLLDVCDAGHCWT